MREANRATALAICLRITVTHLALFCVCICLRAALATGGDVSIAPARSLFRRYADQRLSSVSSGYVANTTVDACAVACVSETQFQCRSFTFDNRHRSCLLYTVNVAERDIRLVAATDVDLYDSAYVRQFRRLPKHRQAVSYDDRSVQDELVTVEECARRCLLSVDRPCHGFNYKPAARYQPCSLLHATSGRGLLAVYADDTDFYQRQPETALSQFVNYGMSVLKPGRSESVYQRTVDSVSVDVCAQLCLNETSFYCLSFDIVFTGAATAAGDVGQCRLSQHVAATVDGLVVDTVNPRHNHYERIEHFMSQFLIVPYSLLPGHNAKTIPHISAEHCAQLCVHDDNIVCRSFDYHVRDGGECNLSEVTASDAGGLNTNAGRKNLVHHFEMKPVLECGGNLTADAGALASPNWPHNYAHHEHCVWNISVSRHKVIHLRFTHLSLWGETDARDACNDVADRVTVEERGRKRVCAGASTNTLVTRTNHATVTFVTNELGHALGFRAFYRAEWPCSAYLQESPGELASPHWPLHYATNLHCTWRISAPAQYRVRLDFSDFNLDRHDLGHCTSQLDHVRLLDGGTLSEPVIGLYCGHMAPFTVLSTHRDMMVQFVSDRHTTRSHNNYNETTFVRRGFHAFFSFQRENDTAFIDDDSSRYIDVGGHSQDWSTDTDYVDYNQDGVDGKARHEFDARQSEQTGDDKHADNNNSLWPVLSFLIVVVVFAAVAFVLVIHHYRQKLSGAREEVVEEQQAQVLEDVPLRAVRSITVTPRFAQPFNNVVDLSAVTAGATVECGSAAAPAPAVVPRSHVSNDSTSPTPIYEHCGPPTSSSSSPPPSAAAERPVPRPRSTYGKYHLENVKNINAESKLASDDTQDDAFSH